MSESSAGTQTVRAPTTRDAGIEFVYVGESTETKMQEVRSVACVPSKSEDVAGASTVKESIVNVLLYVLV